jgi:Cu2+-exporting ATPase
LSTAAATLHPVGVCFHCGLRVPHGVELSVEIDGLSRPMCCPGCQAVAETIVQQDLTDYYRRRDGAAQTAEALVPEALAELRAYDESTLQQDFVQDEPGERKRASLTIEGINCAACAWLIERRLRRHPAVTEINVSLSSHRAQLCWLPSRAKLSELLAEIAAIGYRARPFEPDRHEALMRAERRRVLRRLGVAGLGMMQVMTFAVGLYAGAFQGMEERYRSFFHWVSLIVCTPIVFYSARPFFASALRDLRNGAPGMDVPVALAIGGAYAASTWAIFVGRGDVYFDSVCMFVFFLTLGRFLEFQMRSQADSHARQLIRKTPQTARRISEGEEAIVPARLLQVGDRIRVRAGEAIPADGVVAAGYSSVDRAVLTGEALPKACGPGDSVLGGSFNSESPLEITVTRIGGRTVMAGIVAMLDRAQADRPRVAQLADRIARHFVSGVLLASGLTFAYWWQAAPEAAFGITLATLVITCPCALSLATPVALAAATNGLAGVGLLVLRGHVLEALASASHVVLDKTGTLTFGAFEIVAIRTLAEIDELECTAIASLLEEHSEHPIARAFKPCLEAPRLEHRTARLRLTMGERANVPGFGVEAEIAGRSYRIGRPDWVSAEFGHNEAPAPPDESAHLLLLASDREALAWFVLRDEVRPDARALVQQLSAQGIRTVLLSGDPSPATAQVANTVGVDEWVSGASPAEKLAFVERLQADGAKVAMVGDGINDAPVLARAQVSIAMGGGSDLARIHADAVLVGDDLAALARAFEWARKTRGVIVENLCWALAYNAAALPLAVTGRIEPHWAALGMSASSLLVVANAARLARIRRRR